MAALILYAIFMALISTSSAMTFNVGGRYGWVLNPKESYNTWASRLRFQLNDTIVFKYKQAEDSVLVVNKQAYETCNVSSPIQKLEGGVSMYQLNHSGFHYFISGDPNRCAKGEKLIVLVMAPRNKPISPPPTSSSPPPPPSTISPSPPTPTPLISPSPSPSPSTLATPPTTTSTNAASSTSMSGVFVMGALVLGHAILGGICCCGFV